MGKEQRNGRDLYRIQMVSTVKGQRQVMQMLTPWDMSLLSEEQDYDGEVVMKMGDNPAMVMPIKADKKSDGDVRPAGDLRRDEVPGRGDRGGAGGELQGPALFSGPDGESWVSPDVPGWHMVKMVTKERTDHGAHGHGERCKERDH